MFMNLKKYYKLKWLVFLVVDVYSEISEVILFQMQFHLYQVFFPLTFIEK